MKKRFIFFTVAFLILSCQTKSKNAGSGLDTGADTGSDLGSIFGGSGQNSAGKVAVGSGAGGGLTESDRNAAKNLVADTAAVTPTDGYTIPQDILDQAKKLLEQERQGKDVSAEKMALAGQIINGCISSKKYLVREPFPGQPLMGNWTGGDGCPVSFTVGANPNPDSAAYPVTGGTQGQLAASKDGAGEIKAQPFSGPVTDQPSAARGRLRHPTARASKAGAQPCDVNVQLVSSTNPIPENFKEGVKIQAQCQRQALFFLSPIMDKLFQSMDGNMAKILQQRVVGLQQ